MYQVDRNTLAAQKQINLYVRRLYNNRSNCIFIFDAHEADLCFLVSRSTTTKAVGIAFGLMTFQRLSGVSAVVYYTVDIFRGAGTSIPPTTATIIVGVVSVIASATSACLVDRLGRRFLLILSDSVMAVSLAVMGIYFAYKESGKFKFVCVCMFF